MSKEYETIKSDNNINLDVHSEDSFLNRKNKELILDKHRKIKKRAKKLVISAFISDFFIILMTIISKIIHVIFTVLIIRVVSKKAYGVVSVYLNFIHDIVISFPTQVIRMSASCYSHDQSPVIEKKKFYTLIKIILVS